MAKPGPYRFWVEGIKVPKKIDLILDAPVARFLGVDAQRVRLFGENEIVLTDRDLDLADYVRRDPSTHTEFGIAWDHGEAMSSAFPPIDEPRVERFQPRAIEWPTGDLPSQTVNAVRNATRHVIHLRGSLEASGSVSGEVNATVAPLTASEEVRDAAGDDPSKAAFPDEKSEVPLVELGRLRKVVRVARHFQLRRSLMLLEEQDRTRRVHNRADNTINFISAIVPQRIADEELGDLLEDVHRRIARGERGLVYLRLAYGVLCALAHSIGHIRKAFGHKAG